jgi:hypothetical protein
MLNPASLADPRNANNRPGEGPLRSGGQPGSVAVADKDLPSTPSPLAKRQGAALEMVRDLWGGTDQMRERGLVYLPKAPGEDASNYNTRLQRSVLVNYFRRTVEGLVGLIYRKAPKLGEDVPAAIRQHWENIDLAGTHGDVFARELMQDAEVAGHAAILVEYPHTDGTQTAADEMVGGIRPYWVPVRKENILSWRTTVENGQRVLTQVVLRECQYVSDGEYGEKKQEQYRVLYRHEGVVGWRLLAITENKVVVTVDEGTYPTQAEIPIAEVPTSGSRSLFESDPPLLDIADLNIAHYPQWSDYATSIHMTCVPLLSISGMDQVSNEDAPAVVAGPNSVLAFNNPAARAEYVSHDGAALSACREALDDLKSDIGALGLAMLSPQKRSAETAEAKRLDKASSDSALAVTARGLQDGLERALGFHAKYLRLPSGGSIQINRDFEGLLMDAPVMMAYSALFGAGFPARVILEALQSGGRIAEDANLEELEMEMTANLAAEQRRAEEAAADQMKALEEAA